MQKTIQERAWTRFLQLGLPEKKHPGYQYFPLSQLYQESFALASCSAIQKKSILPLVSPESYQSYIVFVDGHYMPELSDTSRLPPQVVILRLKDALKSYGNFFQVRFKNILQKEEDPFVLLNMAMIHEGLFIYVPPRIVIEPPVQCIHLVTNERPMIFSPRSHFVLGNHSQMKWVYDLHLLKDADYFVNSVVDVALEEGAIFEQFGMINRCQQGWVKESVRAVLKKDSQFKSLTLTTGAKTVHQDFRITLKGENSSCELKGIGILSENKQAHTYVKMEHQAPHCRSMQRFKHILADISRSSFEGKIYVHPKAQKTEAYQLNHNLILSNGAIANSKPNLEIFADDVKASHGATVSQLNPEHLFYLKTRGLSHKMAKKLLISGFILDLFSEVSDPSIREKMQHVAEKFSP